MTHIISTNSYTCPLFSSLLVLISGVFDFSNRCLLRGERCLCWTTSQLCTSRRPSTFPGWLNRASRFQRVLLGCVARQSPSSRLSSSAHPPLFKVKEAVAFRLKKGKRNTRGCVSVECLLNAKKPHGGLFPFDYQWGYPWCVLYFDWWCSVTSLLHLKACLCT